MARIPGIPGEFKKPDTNPLPLHYRFSNAIWRFYTGKTPLARAFWGYFVLGGLVLKGGSGIPLMLGGRTPQTASLSVAMLVAYLVFSVIGVWRCADSHPLPSPWPVIAKVATLLLSATLLSMLFFPR
jgi:hypothetical protein